MIFFTTEGEIFTKIEHLINKSLPTLLSWLFSDVVAHSLDRIQARFTLFLLTSLRTILGVNIKGLNFYVQFWTIFSIIK